MLQHCQPMHGMLGDSIVSWVTASFSLQKTMAEDTVAGLNLKVPNPQRIANWKMKKKCCKINQDLCKMPGHVIQCLGWCVWYPLRLRLFGLSPGSWQTRLGIGYHVPVIYTDVTLYNTNYVLSGTSSHRESAVIFFDLYITNWINIQLFYSYSSCSDVKSIYA